MYSSKVLDHLENPRNVGELADATVKGESTNPVCGDHLYLSLRLEGGTISEARFMVEGCPPSIAAGSVLTEMLIGRGIDESRLLPPAAITAALDSLPRNKEHCSVLAIDALRSALAQLP